MGEKSQIHKNSLFPSLKRDCGTSHPTLFHGIKSANSNVFDRGYWVSLADCVRTRLLLRLMFRELRIKQKFLSKMSVTSTNRKGTTNGCTICGKLMFT
jgi:hypothetical protein